MCAARNRNGRQVLDSAQPKSGNRSDQRRLINADKPQGFAGLPPRVREIALDRRLCSRLPLHLPLRLKRVAGEIQSASEILLTSDISSSGVYFLAPRQIEPGTPIELEVSLAEGSSGHGSEWFSTVAHVVRVELAETPGWHGLAAAFDQISFDRNDRFPRRSAN